MNQPHSRSRWKELFGIDLRTLVLFRIFLAISCLAQIAVMWPDIFAFFDDRGLFPRSQDMAKSSFYSWSLFYVSGHVAWAHILFIVILLSSLALLVGYRSRIAIIILWALIASLWQRTKIFDNGGQMQLTLLLFWAMFLPLSARFSVDAALNKRPKSDVLYFSWATLAVLIQETYLYFFGALLKTGNVWQVSHDAIYYIMHTYDLSSSLGVSLLGPWVEFQRFLTMYVYHLELFAVVFLFFPIKTAWARFAVLPLLISMHLGFALFMSIGIFPLVSIAGLMVFVPGLLWDKLLPWWNRSRQGIALYYDRECEFCRKTCLIFRELALPPETRIVPAQQVPEVNALLQRDNSWVVEDAHGVRRTRWDAVAWVWRRSPLLWPFGLIFLPRFMRVPGDCIYGFIARHRAAFGALSGHFLRESDAKLDFGLHKITQGFIIVLTVILMVWNVGGLPGQKLGSFYTPIKVLLTTLNIHQKWEFFAPGAHRHTLWIVIEGRRADGSMVDLFRETATAPTHDRPQNGYDAYPSNSWWEFFRKADFDKSQELLGHFFCARWNQNHPDMLVKEAVFTAYRQEAPAPENDQPMPVETKGAFSYGCTTHIAESDE